MIAYIEGKIVAQNVDKIIVATTNGVGYEINYSFHAMVGKEVQLYLHHHISENDQSLWGFNTFEEKKVFELLKTVNKVGSSKAYPLVANLGVNGVFNAILLNQDKVLSSVKGIGKKMSEQIILSLKDKVEAFSRDGSLLKAATHDPIHEGILTNEGGDNTHVISETISALESLGYKDPGVLQIVNKNFDHNISSSEELLKKVLKEL